MRAPSRKKLLIVDDEKDLLDMIVLRLKSTGRYDIATACDGRDGLARAAQFRPDLALVDLAMPEIDGWHVCRGLRDDPRTRGVKLVIMTAWLSPDLSRRAASEGVTHLLLKPFEDADLFAALEDGDAAAKSATGGTLS
jgi:CheY-like chemotaxis protein